MLIDSNIIIYAAEPEHADLQRYLDGLSKAVSIASYVEVLGFHGLEEHEKAYFEDFFQRVETLLLTPEIAEAAIGLRQQRRIGLGDAIIAATALEHSLTLVTRNTSDFRWIDNLRLLNPIDQQHT